MLMNLTIIYRTIDKYHCKNKGKNYSKIFK